MSSSSRQTRSSRSPGRCPPMPRAGLLPHRLNRLPRPTTLPISTSPPQLDLARATRLSYSMESRVCRGCPTAAWEGGGGVCEPFRVSNGDITSARTELGFHLHAGATMLLPVLDGAGVLRKSWTRRKRLNGRVRNGRVRVRTVFRRSLRLSGIVAPAMKICRVQVVVWSRDSTFG